MHTCGAGMMGDVIWDKITPKHVEMLKRKTDRLRRKIRDVKPRKRMALRERAEFTLCKVMHRMVMKEEETPSLDNRHYVEHGWIRPV